MPDKHLNFAYSTVATAPSPATTGTSLVVASGTGLLFPAVPFNAVIWPTGQRPLSSNAEVVRVTARTTDTLTIVRAQELSSARTVVVGDQIAAAITTKTLGDIENRQPTYGSGMYYQACATGYGGAYVTGVTIVLNHPYAVGPVPLRAGTLIRVACNVTTATAAGGVLRLGLYADSGFGYPGLLVADWGTVACDTTGTKEITISTAVNDALYWFVICEQVQSGVGVRGCNPSYVNNGLPAEIGAGPPGFVNPAGSWDGDTTSGVLNSNFSASPPPGLSSAYYPAILFRYS
jgi:hypothetical protein